MTSSRDLRIARLHQASERRSAEATARAHRAITAMSGRGERINFQSVSATAGVSKDFLYRNSDLRKRIVEARQAHPAARIPNPEPASDASLRVKLEAVADAAKSLREENRQLRAENARLQGELLRLRRAQPGRHASHT